MHDNDPDKHPKQGFQVERLAFFSDAVFAIAITLLVIEFKVPHITKETTYHEVWLQLLELKGSLLALLLSYFLISTYWMRHHFLFKYIHNYNKQIVVANMVALLPIIFFPFSTAFFADCAQNEHTFMLGIQVFFVNHFAAGLSIYALYWLAVVRHKDLAYDIPAEGKLKFYEDTLFTSLIFVVLFIATLLTENMDILMGLTGICIILRVSLMKLWKRKYKIS